MKQYGNITCDHIFTIFNSNKYTTKKDRDGILLISHRIPDVPVGHVQLKPFNSSVQNPPLRQGELAHSSISKIKKKDVTREKNSLVLDKDN